MSSITKKIAIYTTVVFGIILLIVYFIVLPTIKDIKKISDDVYAERVDLEKKYQRGQLLKKTIEDFEKIKPQEQKLRAAFINQDQELQFITNLEKIATNNRLTQNIRLQEIPQDQAAANYYDLTLNISLEGSFLNIIKYLKELEQSSYYFNISTISFESSNQDQALVNASLKGSIYVLTDSQ